ncbi:hypothetical protein TcasGA2_TC034603 [Tribolium castaneum]|uniref:Uncharacterized protein n=1 Tax=Tribolium castaneum TaxID=7070 RepID=A0A139WKS3_TRICA|nr:hypothetical protein TcasGA2_TC034603 [Tribolium castaneum]
MVEATPRNELRSNMATWCLHPTIRKHHAHVQHICAVYKRKQFYGSAKPTRGDTNSCMFLDETNFE